MKTILNKLKHWIEAKRCLGGIKRKEIMEILKELHAEGRTVILITHDNEIAARARRIIRIMDGKIVDDVMNAEGDCGST